MSCGGRRPTVAAGPETRLAARTPPSGARGPEGSAPALPAPARRASLAAALVGATAFIGLSGPRIASVSALRAMARPRIVFALANPDPEIDPLEAAPEVDVLATGRSDYPNQVNNVLAFPGVFRGLLDARARGVSAEVEL